MKPGGIFTNRPVYALAGLDVGVEVLPDVHR